MRRSFLQYSRESYRISHNVYAKPFQVPVFLQTKNFSDSKRGSKKVTEFRVDTSSFTHLRSMNNDITDSKDQSIASSDGNTNVPSNKEKLSELGADLISYISMKGPITINDYMSYCLNHPTYGYYQRIAEHKIGGQGKGDFITAPEISQLFGEMIAIWLISAWKAMKEPKVVNIIELGPGNGTLMHDILHVMKKFPSFKSCMRIHMVELSNTMKQRQISTLSCKAINTLDLTNIQYATSDSVPISWHSFLHEVPADHPSLIIGQEFLDVFPVHQFLYKQGIWREKLIDIDLDPQSAYHFRTVIAPKETPASKALLGGKYHDKTNASQSFDTSKTPVSSIEDDGVEISPLALATCEDIAIRLRKVGGAALFVDYGENYGQKDSIRGFKQHTQVHYLSEPGVVDMTADVDFSACARAAGRNGVTVYGPITQGEFLLGMGALDRVEQLIESPSVSEDDAEKLVESFKMLIDPQQMGKRFKVLCIADKALQVVGFPVPIVSEYDPVPVTNQPL